MNFRETLFNQLQSLLPQHLLSRLMFIMTRLTWRPWKNAQIRWFSRHYGVDLQEAEYSDANSYTDFNSFFTRALKPGSRPLASDEGALVSPVDGTVSQIGRINQTTILQAKGHDYSIMELLAGDTALANQFSDGHFATLYLAPRDYHRVHMPCSGQLQRMIHVPGARFAVNETSVQGIPRLFARNERLINIFRNDAIDPLALIMIGAMCVGSMQTVWSDPPVARKRGECQDYDYRPLTLMLGRGDEMGRFNMGSTVILLFPPATMEWLPSLQPGQRIRMGQTIGRLHNT